MFNNSYLDRIHYSKLLLLPFTLSSEKSEGKNGILIENTLVTTFQWLLAWNISRTRHGDNVCMYQLSTNTHLHHRVTPQILRERFLDICWIKLFKASMCTCVDSFYPPIIRTVAVCICLASRWLLFLRVFEWKETEPQKKSAKARLSLLDNELRN